MKKLIDRQFQALIKVFPNIKIKDDMYIIFEKTSNYGKNTKDYFIEIISALYNFHICTILINLLYF